MTADELRQTGERRGVSCVSGCVVDRVGARRNGRQFPPVRSDEPLKGGVDKPPSVLQKSPCFLRFLAGVCQRTGGTGR